MRIQPNTKCSNGNFIIQPTHSIVRLVSNSYTILIWQLFYTDTTATATKLGHQQVLWLFGPNHELTEVGAMNIFAVYVNEQGGKNIL